jgi:hypothetical protein
MDKAALDEFYAARNAEGLKINPETARVHWGWGEVMDPNGVDPVPAELRCIGRDYFARDPNSNIWVWFGGLPKQTTEILWERMRRDEDSVVDFPW